MEFIIKNNHPLFFVGDKDIGGEVKRSSEGDSSTRKGESTV